MSDLISRQAAIDALDKRFDSIPIEQTTEILQLRKDLRGFPSAEPERKKGEWIEYPDCLRYDGAYSDDHIVCSECGHVFSILDNCTEEFFFCPHCGADMRGE